MQTRLFLVVVQSFLFTFLQGQGRFGAYRGPSSLGPFDMGRAVLMKSLLATFRQQATGKEIYCLQDIDHGVYLQARSMDDGTGRVAAVLLSSFPNCKGLPIHPASINPTEWRTPDQIGISSSARDVVQKYGKPDYERPIKANDARGIVANPRGIDLSGVYVGDLRLVYTCSISEKQGCTDDPRVAEFGLSKGKVIWIRMSVGE